MLGTVGILIAGLLGYGTLDVYDKVPGVLTRAAAPVSTTTQAPRTRVQALGPGPVLGAPAPSSDRGGVVALSSSAAVPTAAGVRAALAPLVSAKHNPLGPKFAVVVRDAATSRHLYDLNATTPMTPASITKLTAALAITSTLPTGQRLTTRVVAGSKAGEVVLVAGGDTLLSPGEGDPDAVLGHAGLATLAAVVAARLRAGGHSPQTIEVGVDDSYARGPAYAPGWSNEDVAMGYVGPVAPIGLASQFPVAGHPGSTDPAISTAKALGAALSRQGLKIADVQRARAPAHARLLGSVQSATVAQILAKALQDSDNALTESLVRLAAVRARHGTSFASMTAFVRASLARAGIDIAGVRLADDCGLSHGTRIPPRVQADILDLAASGKDPRLADVLAQLPIAALTGTLDDRFLVGPPAYAAGLARAKTGTLPTVAALAGTVVDASGRLLTYVVVSNKLRNSYPVLGARQASDQLVSVLARCGCR